MITITIIVASLVLALAYAAVWVFVPRARRQIEQPKHWFVEQARQYDRACRETPAGKDEQDDV